MGARDFTKTTSPVLRRKKENGEREKRGKIRIARLRKNGLRSRNKDDQKPQHPRS
jgi:hypothetical protein